MSSVDERIVEMQFDNQQFEKGVETTLNSLDKLDESLKLEGAKEGLKNIADYSKGFDLGNIADAVDDISDRFSALGIIGKRILEDLTDAAWNLGVNFAKSLTVDQIAAGWQKFETGNRNTLTLMNQADETLEEAEHHMAKLSWYSDVTSFDMNAMSTALGSFTTAGVDTDEAVQAIMGIGNSITFAGKSAQEGAGVFDIYSKAMSQGYMSLKQWQQLSLRGVVTAKMKRQFLEAAEAIGTLRKTGDDAWETMEGLRVTTDNFTETLGAKKGKWLNNAVMNSVFAEMGGKYANDLAEMTLSIQEEEDVVLSLTEAMERYGGIEDEMAKKYLESATLCRTYADAVDAVRDATSTLMGNMFKSVFGNVDEATELWSEFSEVLLDIVTGPLLKVATVLESWKKLGGRTILIETIKQIYNTVKKYLEPIGLALEKVFGVKPVKDKAMGLINLTTRVYEFFKGLMPGEETLEKLTNAWTGFFSVLKMVKTTFGFVIKVLTPLWPILRKIGSLILTISSYVGIAIEYIANFYEQLFSLNFFKNPFGTLATKLTTFNTEWEYLLQMLDTAKQVFDGLGGGVTGFIKAVGIAGKGVIGVLLSPLTDLFGIDTTKLKNKLIEIWAFLTGKLAKAVEFVKEGFTATFGEDATIFSVIGSAFSAMIKAFKNNLKTLGEYIPQLWAKIKGLFGKDKDITEQEGKARKLTSIIGSLGYFIGKVSEAVSRFFGGLTIKDIFDDINSVLASGALYQLIGLFKNTKDVMGSLSKGIESFFNNTGKVLKAFQSQVKAKALKQIAEAVLILVASIIALTFVDQSKLASAMEVIVVLFVGLTAVANKLLKMPTVGRNDFSKGFDILAIAGAIAMLSAAVYEIAKLSMTVPPEKLREAVFIVGLIATVLAVIVSASEKTSMNTRFAIGKGTGSEIIKIALAMYIMGKSFEQFADLDEKAMSRGLEVFTYIGAFIAAISFIQGKWKGDVTSGSTAFFKMAASFTAIALAFKTMGEIENLDAVTKSLAGISLIFGLIIGISAIALSAGNYQKSLSSIGTAFLLMSIALIPMAIVMKQLGQITPEQLSQANAALVGIGAMIAVMVVAIGAVALIMSKLDNITTRSKKSSGVNGIFGAIFGGYNSKSDDYSKKGATVIEIAGAFLIMASSMVVLAAAFKILGSMTGGQVLISLGAMAGALLLLVGAAAVMQAVGLTSAVTALGKAFLMMGASLALAGVGMGLIAAAVIPFAMAFVAAIPLIIVALVELVSGFGAVIEAAGGLIGKICAVLIQNLPVLSQTLYVILNTIIDIASMLIPAAIRLIGTIVIKILETLIVILPTVVENLVVLIITLFRSLGDSIFSHRGEIIDSISYFLGSLFSLVWEVLTQIIEKIVGTFSPALAEKIRGAMDESIEWMMSDSAASYAQQTGEELANLTTEGQLNQLEERKEDIKAASKELPLAAEEGYTEGMEDAKEGINQATEETFTSSLQDTFSTIFGEGGGVNLPFEFGVGVGENSIMGLTDPAMLKDLSDVSYDNGAMIVDKTEEGTEADGGSEAVSDNVLQGLINGLLGKNSGVLKNTAYNVGTTIIDKIKEGSGVHSPSVYTMETGEYIDEGLLIGMENGFDAIKVNAVRMGEILNGILYDNVASLSNPINRVSREIGEGIAENTIEGLESKDQEVATAAEETADTVVKNITGPLWMIQKILDEELMVDPTITPVLDLTNVENGLKALDERYKDYGLNVASSFWKGASISDKLDMMQAANMMNKEVDATVHPNEGTTKQNATYTFVQNNYSPKALSESEIYRKTSNQLSAMTSAAPASNARVGYTPISALAH